MTVKRLRQPTTTETLRDLADIEAGFRVESTSAWILQCLVCDEHTQVTATPGTVNRRAVIRDGRNWMTDHRLKCPGRGQTVEKR